MSPISASQIAQFKATLVSFYKSTWTHPRHNARVWLLSALSVGGVLNFLSTIAALMERYENAPIVVAVWAGVVLSISMCYQILDLYCSPSRSTDADQQQQQRSEFFNIHLPAPFVALVDILGFLGFLALLIANTIVVSHLKRPSQIYIFNSIPWVICCIYHGLIAAQALPSIFAQHSTRQRDYCCVDCKREAERRDGKSAAAVDEGGTLLRNMDGSESV